MSQLAASILLMLRTYTNQSISASEAVKRAELYFAAHPGSPSATRRPALIPRSGTWVAIVGENIQQSIVGLGATVESALRAFDSQYLDAHPPDDPRNPPV